MANIGITGAAGRMGRTLTQSIFETDGLDLRAALEHPDSEHVGVDAGVLAGIGPLEVAIGTDLHDALEPIDVLIDFSVTEATLRAASACRDARRGMVIGTTGFDVAGLDAIRTAARDIPILMAPNMSVGVNVAFKLIELAALALGDDVDVEVYEMHHRHKVDAPSGTAVRMGEILASSLGRDLADDAMYGRVGLTGERERTTIGFHSARGGDVVGDHTVMFAGVGERIEITHRAQSRANFAAGAMRAAQFIAQKRDAGEIGMFSMDDVLGL